MINFRPVRILVSLAAVSLGCLSELAADQVLLAPEDFIRQSFAEEPESKVIWLDRELKEAANEILGHGYKGLRIRYWQSGDRTAWVLDEIGKVKPITAGFVVDDGVLQEMRVLVYRESHGWEVRYPFFTRQFKGRTLDEKKQLDEEIDGISGATLSVNALVRLSRLALYLHQKALP